MILAVDTSLGTAVALIDSDGTLRAQASSPDALGHAEVIGGMLQQVLAEAGSDEITHVVAGMGPGPFTGLRIGIATARAFALGRGIPVVAVPSHLAAALSVIAPSAGSGGGVRGSGGGPAAGLGDPGIDAAPFAIVTDARRREVAISVFESVDAVGIPNLIQPTVLVPRADADDNLRGLHSIEVAVLDAADLARVGIRAANAGRELTGAEPLYLRQPDVTVPGAPKKVGS